MSTVRHKSRYDKEMTAVTYNLKEQRVLEKSMQTLRLEQAYAMKLLELDNRIVKVHYKKLKERVSKIKSHLPPEDISKFRDLDQKGKLKPTISGVSSSGAIKIAAASRRLNLGGEDTRRLSVRSAVPRISVVEEHNSRVRNGDCAAALGDEHAQEIGMLRRSNSVTGVFIDAPEPDRTVRPGSASVLVPKSLTAADRPRTAVAAKTEEISNLSSEEEKHRPTTSVRYRTGSHDEPEGTWVGDASFSGTTRIALEKRPSTTPHLQQTHSPFSSHVTAEKEARGNGLPVPLRSDRGRKMSCISRDSIDSNLGDNLFEERRQELLEEESVRAATLDKRTQTFLRDVDDYLQRNPPLQPSHMAFENTPREPLRRDSFINARPESAPRAAKPSRYPQRRNDGRDNMMATPTFFPEDKYREKLMSMWKDLSKCRYLRMSDERIDLSGVNTLVKDQMKLFETLRHAETTPITGRAEF